MRKTRLNETEGAVGEHLYTEQAQCAECGEWTDLDDLREPDGCMEEELHELCPKCLAKHQPPVEPECSICRISFPCNCAQEIELL